MQLLEFINYDIVTIGLPKPDEMGRYNYIAHAMEAAQSVEDDVINWDYVVSYGYWIGTLVIGQHYWRITPIEQE